MYCAGWCASCASLKKSFMRLLGVAKICLDGAAELDRHGIAVAVLGVAGRDANPALAHAVLFHVRLLDALEADSDAPLEQGGVEVRALRIGREAVRRGVGH